ncbi:hypothetical protein HX005_13175 [Acinetobacter sp. R933-2]|nr:hypothetical protein [Acinetobacter sp. R933-2]
MLVFDWFYQVNGSWHKKVQTGGLGLVIVQLHGGWVEVENKEKGVVFWVFSVDTVILVETNIFITF